MYKYYKYNELTGEFTNFKPPLIVNDVEILNPTHEQMLNEGWYFYTINPTSLEQVKEKKIHKIDMYDTSTAVNEFFIGETGIWMDKPTRTGLLLTFDAVEAAGDAVYTLWYGDFSFVLPINVARQMLYAIEVYASQCFCTTATHKSNVKALQTIDEVNNYDYMTGYPQKLHFSMHELSDEGSNNGSNDGNY